MRPIVENGRVLLEFTYRDILNHIGLANPVGAKSPKLPYRDWERLIQSCKMYGMGQTLSHHRDTAMFHLPNRYNGWNTWVQFVQWGDEITDTRLSPRDAAKLLIWEGDIRFHCGCPSYKFWGHQYVATELGCAIEPEGRFPKVRNPNLVGAGCCKHLRKTMRVLPFYSADFAKHIEEQRRDHSERISEG